MLEQVVSSNAVQLMATAAMGGLSYLFVARWPVIIVLAGYMVAALLTVSFLFQVGEVYNYSDLYRRAFFHFGDDVTTWLTPIYIWAVLEKRRFLAVAVACGILFSGTKISIFLLLLQFLFVVLISKGERRALSLDVLKSIAIAAVVYLSLALASPYAVRTSNQVAQVATCDAAADAGCGQIFQESMRGYGNCRGGDCLDATILRPLRHRAFSAVAGFWMTLQGGFTGPRYPNSPERFADLMIEANPWGINDTFDVSRDEWMKIGTVQTPYLQFGAGYGPGLLACLLVGIAGIGILALRTIASGERGPFLAYSVFFIVNAVFNQTQPWLGRGPILFMMGLCAACIIVTFVRQRSTSRTLSNA